CAREGGFAYW
nr:immunoglobulin heavy chain junction region [Mus musculus]